MARSAPNDLMRGMKMIDMGAPLSLRVSEYIIEIRCNIPLESY